jgi:hypothetical protein
LQTKETEIDPALRTAAGMADDDDENQQQKHQATFIVRRGKSARYYAFKMDHIYACNNRDMRPERLLELAYQYTSQSAS